MLARDTRHLLNFASYPVVAALGNALTQDQKKDYEESLTRMLGDESVVRIFEADGTLALAKNLQNSLSRPDSRLQISKELLRSIARVVIAKKGIIREVDAFNPGTLAGFRGPLRELSRLSGIEITP